MSRVAKDNPHLESILSTLSQINKTISTEVSTYKKMGVTPQINTQLTTISNKLTELYKMIKETQYKQSTLNDF